MSFENIRALLDKMQACNVPDYELIVFHNGTQVYKEVKNTSRITPEMHLFNWYSCSKFITCAATMKLFEEGKFSLDDDVAEYLPAFANITVSKNGGVYPAELIAHTLRMFGAGVKVGIECAVMALDAGCLNADEDVIAIGGTGRGADTVCILTPSYTADFLSTKIHEILCKPGLY